MNTGITIAVAVLALGVAFLFSGMEAGVFALSRFRIRRMARQGDHRAARLQHYLDRPENFLWTIVVGNALATLVVVSLAAQHLERWLTSRSLYFAPVVAVVLLVWYVFGDLLPKILFRRFPNRLCMLCIGPFRLLHGVLSPLVGIAEWIARQMLRWSGGREFTGRLFGTRAELRQVIEASSQALSSEEVVMINRILDLQNRRVRDVMTPMAKAATLESTAVVADLCRLGRERRISYVPLWQGSGGRRRVLGVAPLSSVLYDATVLPDAPLETLVQPALFVDEGMRLEDALRVMQRSRHRLAIVLNAQRRETGVVTLNDILRAMFGEVRV